MVGNLDEIAQIAGGRTGDHGIIRSGSGHDEINSGDDGGRFSGRVVGVVAVGSRGRFEAGGAANCSVVGRVGIDIQGNGQVGSFADGKVEGPEAVGIVCRSEGSIYWNNRLHRDAGRKAQCFPNVDVAGMGRSTVGSRHNVNEVPWS